MILRFANNDILLDPSGVAVLTDSKTAIVSDLHLEKGSSYAARGFFLPPYDTEETLSTLLPVLIHQDIERLILLGDSFHDAGGYSRLSKEAKIMFHRLLDFNPLWIKGNHDGGFVPDGFAAHDVYLQDGIVFRHEALPGAAPEISGHFHPKAVIEHKGARIDRSCFIEDGKKMIMPAFGAFTGGLSIEHPSVKTLFENKCRVHILGFDRIFSFSPDKLRP